MAGNLSTLQKDIAAYIQALATQGIRVERYEFPERLEVLARATLHVPGPLEVIDYTPEEVQGKEGKSIFWDEICATGKVLYEAA